MTEGQWIVEDSEVRGRGLMEVLSRYLSRVTEVKVACLPVEILTEHLPNTAFPLR
jgi:hypothetical protein